jgi:uncharacterized protein YutE (UPF0331/DUF86 family)
VVDTRLVDRKLAALRERIARVRATMPGDEQTFLADADRRELVAFNLFLAFQEALDLAAHLIADGGWDVPATAREHFETLARHGLIAAALAKDLGACAGVRNLIAHAYGTLDFARLYAEAPVGLAALERFAEAMARA